MTAARQPSKFVRTFARALAGTLARTLVLALIVGGGCVVPPIPQPAAGQVEVNADTGLAISGFDPLAYFADGKPELGHPGLELRLDGAVWQFRNKGNLAAFAEHPNVYMPRFGGYDPVAIARGDSVPGNPLIWAIVGERLYLFYDAKARATFMADAGRIIVTADRKWPAIAATLGH